MACTKWIGSPRFERVRSVGVTEPVRADSLNDTGSLGGTPHDDADAPAVQWLSAPGSKNWLLGLRRSAPAHQLPPNLGGQGNRPCPTVLSEYRNLASVASSVQVAPEQVARFRHTPAGGIEQPQQNAITRFCFGGEDPLNILLSEDPFRQAILVAGQRQFRRRVDWQIPQPIAEAKQAARVRTREIGARPELARDWAKLCKSARVMRERGFLA